MEGDDTTVDISPGWGLQVTVEWAKGKLERRGWGIFHGFCTLCARILPDLGVGVSTWGLESSQPKFKIFSNPGAWDESLLFLSLCLFSSVKWGKESLPTWWLIWGLNEIMYVQCLVHRGWWQLMIRHQKELRRNKWWRRYNRCCCPQETYQLGALVSPFVKN